MIVVDPSVPEPPYDQVKAQIAAAVASGELRPGAGCPRSGGSAELDLAPNTVARAYRELEAAGVVDTRGRSGTFVAGDEVDRAAREAAAAYARRVRELGLSRAEALALVERTLAARRSPPRILGGLATTDRVCAKEARSSRRVVGSRRVRSSARRTSYTPNSPRGSL